MFVFFFGGGWGGVGMGRRGGEEGGDGKWGEWRGENRNIKLLI